ncbi:hypothetical protein Tco_0363159 [Tanacetum coccineum]
MVIEEPEYGMFFIDVFDDEACQTMSDINKVGLETLITYLVMASNITTLENTRFCLNLRKLIADHPDQEKLKSKKMDANQTTNNNLIRSILKKEKLNGNNFLDWYRNLRIVLGNEQKLHHLEEALPEVPPATTTIVVRNSYARRVAKQQEVAYLMLLKKNKATTSGTSGIRGIQKLNKGALDLYVGNGNRAAV